MEMYNTNRMKRREMRLHVAASDAVVCVQRRVCHLQAAMQQCEAVGR